MIQYFTDDYYRGLVTVPEVQLFKNNQKAWVAEIWLAEELFHYLHPFMFEDLFKNKLTKDQFQAQLTFLLAFSVLAIEKVFDVEEFFNLINLRNNQLIKIKKNIIQLLNELAENNIIQNTVEIVLKSGKKKDQLIRNLTLSDITRRIKYLKFYEILKQ